MMGNPVILDNVLTELKVVESVQLPGFRGEGHEASLALVPASVVTRTEAGHVKFSSLQMGPVGRKRKVVTKLDHFGKKYLAFPDSTLEIEDNVSLILQHKNGRMLVSPEKKKVGRLKGSKNRVKSTEEQDQKIIRKYKSRGKALSFDQNLDESVLEKVGPQVVVVVMAGAHETAQALESTDVEGSVECDGSHSANIVV